MLTALLLVASAMAGDLYVNNVLVNPADLAGMTLQKVNVTVSPNGDLLIDAPGYSVQPASPAAATAPPAAPARPATPAAPATAARPAPPAAPARPAAPAGQGVPPASWWLVTEDNGSSGHLVDVLINGQLVQTVRSGEQQRIIDVSSWLRPGPNQVECRSQSTTPGGGPLYVYLGRGTDQSGNLVMDAPSVQYGLGASRKGAYSRQFTVNAP